MPKVTLRSITILQVEDDKSEVQVYFYFKHVVDFTRVVDYLDKNPDLSFNEIRSFIRKELRIGY